MHVRADSLDVEVRLTIEAAVEVANVLEGNPVANDGPGDDPVEQVRAVLAEHDFLRAPRVTAAEMEECLDRCAPIARLIRSLPDLDLVDAVAGVNHHLQSGAIAPSLRAHDGFPLHIHWTLAETPFAHQVAVDVLMALAQDLCDHGTARYGRCGADGCERVFYDSSKNGSRRFCSDPRCASRTHTAAHRARRRSA